jgi:hypothetical protein
MSKMSKFLIATVLCAIALPTAVIAAPITGTGQGSFSNLSSCDNSGSSQDCRIVNTGANGSNTQVQWGTTSSRNDFVNPSTLTAVDLALNVINNATNVKIAQLTWFNSATLSQSDLSSFGVDYNLTIAFTSPVGASGDSELFDLTIANPSNPPGDVISSFTLNDLANLSFNLPGWTVSNLHYVADSGTSLCGNNNTSWCNPEGNTGNLYIEANFTKTNVPEPLTLSLFSAGLAGVAALRRRRKQTQA